MSRTQLNFQNCSFKYIVPFKSTTVLEKAKNLNGFLPIYI